MATACALWTAPAATRRGASASAPIRCAVAPRAGAGVAGAATLRLGGRQAAPRPAGRAVRVVVRAAKSSSASTPVPPPPPPPVIPGSDAVWAPQASFPPAPTAGLPGPGEPLPPGYIPFAGMPGQPTPQMYPYGHPFYGAPVPPPPPSATSSGVPWMWVGVGVLAAVLFGQVTKWIKGKQAGFQQMMMQQVMQQMMSSAGAKSGMPGGMPPGFPGAMGGMPPRAGGVPPGMGGFGGPAGASAAARSAPVDVTATVKPAEAKPAAAAAAASPATAAAPAAEAPKAQEARPHFQDVDVTAEPAAAAGGAAAGSTAAPGGVSFEMMEQMLDNPEMLKMLYPTLPEAFRSPEKVKWLLSQPGARQQMEAMLAGGTTGFPPVSAEAIRNFDVNSPEVKAQFEQMGMTPEEMMTKVMSNPRLMELMMKPKVMSAIMDLQNNPANIQKYLNDPEVMGAFTELTELLGPPGATMPGMPPNFGA